MPSGSIYRRLLWPVYAPSTLLGVAAGATVPVQVVAAMHLGASGSVAALAVAGAGAIGLVSTVSAGRLIDRIGDRRAMLLATVFASATEIVAIIALILGGPVALAAFIASALLRAPALNVWGLARQAFTAEHVAPDEVGRAMTGLGGTMRIGALIGPLLGGLLLLALPLWSVYVLSVGCAVLAMLVLYSPALGGRLEKPAPSAAPHPDADAPATAGSDIADPVPAPVPAADAPAPRAARGRLDVDWTRVLLAGIAICTLSVARASQPVLVQLWGVHVGLDASHIALLVAAGAAIEIVCMVPGGSLKDRLGRSIILTVCLAIYGTGFLLLVPLTAVAGVAGMAGAVVVMSVGNGLGAGVNMTIGADLSPAVGRGRFLGVWALFNNIGALGGPLLISGLVSVATEGTAIAAIGGVALAGAVWVVACARRMALPRGIVRAH
ncbi:MFS transporter [Brachybacterium nesterenkovii]|uniref:Probable transporter n=1 Tax=Brachybacterium nesterenkovii TaxID=47847 RepID=A0A1X6WU76_9MICO|nr:MFS transporter [Brachybacterium nesterenkovii]SLM88745.1 Probable transporter [Brachybacterium nesterenkovii]